MLCFIGSLPIAAAVIVAAGVAATAVVVIIAAGVVVVAAAVVVVTAGIIVAATAAVGAAAVLTGVTVVAVVLERRRLLDQRSQLEAVGMVAAAIRFGVDVMDVLAIAHVYGRLGGAAELMEVAVCKVGAESHLMHVAVAIFDRFTGNGGNAVIVALAAADVGFGDADDLVDVLLFVTAVASVGSHIF